MCCLMGINYQDVKTFERVSHNRAESLLDFLQVFEGYSICQEVTSLVDKCLLNSFCITNLNVSYLSLIINGTNILTKQK